MSDASAADRLVEPLPAEILAARRRGEAWAIRVACVWDTIERYAAVRHRHDRLPAERLIARLAEDVSSLTDVGAIDGSRWAAIARRLEASCDDPLGEAPAQAIADLIALCCDCEASTAA